VLLWTVTARRTGQRRFGRGRLDSWMAAALHFRGLRSLLSWTRCAVTHRTSSICLGAWSVTASTGLSRGKAIPIRTPLTTRQTASSAAFSRTLSGQLSPVHPATTRTTEVLRGHHPRLALERGMPKVCRTSGPRRGRPRRVLLACPPHACFSRARTDASWRQTTELRRQR